MSKFFKSIKNKISSVFNENSTPIKNIFNSFQNNQTKIDEKKYNSSFVPLNNYYKQEPHTKNPILYIAVISFNQKKGSIIEFTYPEKSVLLEKNQDSKLFFESLIDKNNKESDTTEKIFNNINNQLTYLCIPDGAHSLTSDSTFFLIQNFPRILFGISCYRQLKITQAMKEDEQENTRDCVQKAMCIISTLPLFGQMASKLSVTMLAYFNQDSLKDKKIIADLYSNYANNFMNKIKIDEILENFSLKRLIYFTRDKIFILIKLILLEKKILVFSHISNNICSFIFSFLSLFPGGAFFNMNNEGRAKCFYDCYSPYGLPLKFLNKNSILYSILTLYDVDKLEKKNIISYFVGTTNPLLLNYGKIDFDCIINLDENKITINKKINADMLNSGKKENSLMNKLYKECKYLFEDNIEEDLNDTWMLDKEESTNKKKSKKKKKSIYLQDMAGFASFSGSDDYIRNMFKKYITNFLADIHLAQYITNSSGYTDEVKLSKIKDVLNDYNCEFIYNWITKTNNFIFWNYEHDNNLWRYSPHLKKCKNAKKFYENGDIYEGELAFGEPNNNGKLEYHIDDIPYIYIGEFHKGLKHGKGNLSTKENNKFNYDGDWMYDKYEGYGTLFNFGEKYIGNFKKGKKCGEGTLYKNNGDIIEGEFSDGKIIKGKIMYKNEDEYEGEFIDGKISGKGIYKYKNGDIYEGFFENELFNGEGKITKSNGEVDKGIFKDGILVQKLDKLKYEEEENNEINNKEIDNKNEIKENKENNNDIDNEIDEKIININEENKRKKNSVENIYKNYDNISIDDSLEIGTNSHNVTIESIYQDENK